MDNEHTILKNKGMWSGSLLVFESLPSTNAWCLENIRDLHHGDVVLAIRQTSGRGRFDRTWHSFGERGLAFSFIVDPSNLHNTPAHWVGPVTAIALVLALGQAGVKPMLKWPNDVLARGRKIAGILSQKDDRTGLLVCGVGLNVIVTENDLLEAKLATPSTSMLIETGRQFAPEQVLTDLLKSLDSAFTSMMTNGASWIAETWKTSDFLAGKRIKVAPAEETMISGAYSGMTEEGRLALIDDAGTMHLFWTGDVTLRAE